MGMILFIILGIMYILYFHVARYRLTPAGPNIDKILITNT